MRVGVATVQVPFMRGGAEEHATGLVEALRRAGHEVDLITMPFRFSPIHEVERSMQIWSAEQFEEINGYELDRLICLRFPAYYVNHPRKVVWLLHQHRAVYDLWDTPFSGGLPAIPEGQRLREQITRMDTEALTKCGCLFANSRNVAI